MTSSIFDHLSHGGLSGHFGGDFGGRVQVVFRWRHRGWISSSGIRQPWAQWRRVSVCICQCVDLLLFTADVIISTSLCTRGGLVSPLEARAGCVAPPPPPKARAGGDTPPTRNRLNKMKITKPLPLWLNRQGEHLATKQENDTSLTLI